MAHDNSAARFAQARLHWITYRWPAIWLVIAMITFSAGGEASESAPGLVLLSAILFIRPALRSWQSEFVLTEDKIILRKGIIRKNVTELDLRQFEAVKISQGLLGRWWDFGTVTITGTGGVRQTLDDVIHPEKFKASLEAYLHKSNASNE